MAIDGLKKNGLFTNGPFFWYQYFPGLVFWMLMTLPVLRLFSKTASLPVARRIATIIGLGILLGIVKNLFAWFSYFISGTLAGKYSFSIVSLDEFFSRVTFFYYMESIIIAWVLLIIFFIVELYRGYQIKTEEAARLQAQLANAQLETLRMQLQPHFLFNAHNTVSMLIRTKKYEQATEMISKISDLLRNSLSGQKAQFTPLKDELSALKAYLEIEQIRFEDHLSIKLDTDSSTDNILIPQLLLQPIIENAFKHGISKNLGPSELILKTRMLKDKLHISVYNTGPALAENWRLKDQQGIGLSNTIKRLSALYNGDNYGFSLQNKNEGVIARITLPLKINTDESD
ncbi:MAG: histidine kinase [Roseivirga sp.]|nr:histidine kinase [Roseivirga sp.]